MMKRTADIVVGLGFGDEGKGSTVDRLCRASISRGTTPLVARFSGGHQAGHTVVCEDGRRHVFSQLGSGALAGCPTYLGPGFTFDPIGFLAERSKVETLGGCTDVSVDPDALLVTPLDMAWNKATSGNGHGTCGVGFGATVERDLKVSMRVRDLLHLGVLRHRLACVEDYYRRAASGRHQMEVMSAILRDSDYLDACARVTPMIEVRRQSSPHFGHVVMEGSQGVMLDERHGFFPHVTRSKTTSVNALRMLRRWSAGHEPTVWEVTRAYATRHGNGPLPGEGMTSPIVRRNHAETNVDNRWQGKLREAPLDLGLLRYARSCEEADSSSDLERVLVVTCVDQVDGIPTVCDGLLDGPLALATSLGAKRVVSSVSEVGLPMEEPCSVH